MVVAEQIRKTQGQIQVALDEIELVQFAGADSGTFTLDSGSSETKAENRGELVAEIDSTSGRKQIGESGLAHGVSDATHQLPVSMRTELDVRVALALLRHRHAGEERNGQNQCQAFELHTYIIIIKKYSPILVTQSHKISAQSAVVPSGEYHIRWQN